LFLGGLAATPGASDAAVRQRILTGLELEHTVANRGLAYPGHPRHGPYATVSEESRLLPQHQTPLTLVQVRQHDLESQRELVQNVVGEAHIRATGLSDESNGLFLDGFTCCGTPSAMPPARTGTRSPAFSSPSTPLRPRKQRSSGSPSSPTRGARKYPAIVRLWETAWEEFMPFLRFETEIRRTVCTTNAIESVSARIRRAVKARGHFPNETAALKCVYISHHVAGPTGKGQARWTMRWKTVLNAFDITFDGRLSAARQ
jgi:hypothetical protein